MIGHGSNGPYTLRFKGYEAPTFGGIGAAGYGGGAGASHFGVGAAGGMVSFDPETIALTRQLVEAMGVKPTEVEWRMVFPPLNADGTRGGGGGGIDIGRRDLMLGAMNAVCMGWRPSK